LETIEGKVFENDYEVDAFYFAAVIAFFYCFAKYFDFKFAPVNINIWIYRCCN